jgi:hypothetical protein
MGTKEVKVEKVESMKEQNKRYEMERSSQTHKTYYIPRER